MVDNLVSSIRNKQDLTCPLAALEEYNTLTQQKQMDLEESTTHKM